MFHKVVQVIPTNDFRVSEFNDLLNDKDTCESLYSTG